MQDSIYRSIFKGKEIDQILGGAIPHLRLTMPEYEKLIKDEEIKNPVWYCIYDDAQMTDISKIFIGHRLLIDVKEQHEGLMREVRLSEEEYQKLRDDKKIVPGTWYSVYTDFAHKRLKALYNGSVLILKQSDQASTGFPYTFPIIL